MFPTLLQLLQYIKEVIIINYMVISGFHLPQIVKWRTKNHIIYRLALARVVPEEKVTDFRKYPLSLFIMRVKKDDGSLNNIKIMTMKDKMGTR